MYLLQIFEMLCRQQREFIIMVIEVTMKLTLVIMEMIMGKEVDVKVDWEVDEDVPIFRI